MASTALEFYILYVWKEKMDEIKIESSLFIVYFVQKSQFIFYIVFILYIIETEER